MPAMPDLKSRRSEHTGHFGPNGSLPCASRRHDPWPAIGLVLLARSESPLSHTVRRPASGEEEDSVTILLGVYGFGDTPAGSIRTLPLAARRRRRAAGAVEGPGPAGGHFRAARRGVGPTDSRRRPIIITLPSDLVPRRNGPESTSRLPQYRREAPDPLAALASVCPTCVIGSCSEPKAVLHAVNTEYGSYRAFTQVMGLTAQDRMFTPQVLTHGVGSVTGTVTTLLLGRDARSSWTIGSQTPRWR
jgi:hypothetical protein